MDILARAAVFLFTGLVLLMANLWFIRTVQKHYFSTDYVVAPFNVLDVSGGVATDKAGEALARMMTAQLRNIQTRMGTTTAPKSLVPPRDLDVLVLFVPEGVDVPTGLFEPVDIKASVGGVEVGGVFSWFQGALAKEKVIRFTTYEKPEMSVVSADVDNFAPGMGDIWFESKKDADEIATNAAYALIQLKLAERGSSQLRRLPLGDFRTLLDTVFKVTEYNQRAASGYIVTDDFAALLPAIEKQLADVPDWPELVYLTGRIAEAAANLSSATTYYRRLEALSADTARQVDARMVSDVKQRLGSIGPADQQFADEKQRQFVNAASDFARKMGLKGDDPDIAFVEQEHGVQALWNEEKRRMEVNPLFIGEPGMPQYVALMGRFLGRFLDRCFGGDKAGNDYKFWNEFRHSVVGYLVQSETAFRGVQNIAANAALYKLFKDIEKASGVDPTKRLALEVLDRYDCDWSNANIVATLVAINKERGFMPESAIVTSARAANFPMPVADKQTEQP